METCIEVVAVRPKRPGPPRGCPSPNPAGRPAGQLVFIRERQLVFLETFKATNRWIESARAAGVSYGCVRDLVGCNKTLSLLT